MSKLKKFVSLMLVLCLCAGIFSTTTQAAGNGIPEEKLDELHDFLVQFEWGWVDLRFDFRSPTMPSPNEYGTSRSILQALIGNGVAYAGPVPGADHFYGETDWDGKDPLGKWVGYHKTSSAWTDWVLENVFNCSQADISVLRDSLSNSQDSYYLDGYYYASAGGIGGPSPIAVFTDIVPYENYYFITYELRMMEEDGGAYVGRRFAVVQRKAIAETGKGYWSLYYFKELAEGETVDLPSASTAAPPASADNFNDVKQSDYFYNAVHWGVEQGIVAGSGANTFSPNATCTKAQILTFLWRANGSPEPTRGNQFTDLLESRYYYKAALWAYEKALIPAKTFNADEPCTRAMTVTYLWKLAGSPVVEGDAFSDVPYTSEYVRAVLWAVDKGITGGTGGTTFSPDAVCTRAQIITFLYRNAGFETVAKPNLKPGATDTYASWSGAYEDFVVNGKYLTAVYDYKESDDPAHPWGTDFDHTAALYDMDADGVPELFMYNGYESRYMDGYYVYTFEDEQIRYIGRTKMLAYKPGSQFTGIWSYWTAWGTEPDYYTYFRKEGGQLYSESVYSQEFDSSYKKPETDNTALYNEFVSTDFFQLSHPRQIAVKEIQSMGWDAFVNSALG